MQQGEPAALHFRARYLSRGAAHQVELWRDGDRRLVRRTDGAIEIHVARSAGDPAYQMVVLDLRRKIESRLTRDDMYRIGSFTDWFDLAHGLRQPKAGYHLASSSAPAGAPTPVKSCKWYVLEQAGRKSQVCWSTQEHLPMLILADDGKAVWEVTEVTRAPVPPAVFQLHDVGFVLNDAHQDITGD